MNKQKTDAIVKLHEAFKECWVADTSNIADEAWEDIDNSAGQQMATSLVAQDILGGDIKRIQVAVGNTYVSHYVNCLPNGMIVDFTAKQFESNGTFINGPVRVERDLMLPTEAAQARYLRLKKRVEAYMSND